MIKEYSSITEEAEEKEEEGPYNYKCVDYSWGAF